MHMLSLHLLIPNTNRTRITLPCRSDCGEYSALLSFLRLITLVDKLWFDADAIFHSAISPPFGGMPFGAACQPLLAMPLHLQ